MGTLLFAAALLAHQDNLSESRLTVQGREVVWRVKVGTPDLQKALRFKESPLELTEGRLQELKPGIAGVLLSGLAIEIDGRAVEPEIGPLEPGYETYFLTGEPFIGHATLELRYRASGEVGRVRARVRFFADLTDRHRAIVDVQWGGKRTQFTSEGPRELNLTPESLDPSFWRTGGQFVLWGVQHIFMGFDHIAFLLALLLGARRLGGLVAIVTSFTVAHSITLLLSALNLIRLDPRITEALIAASIVYVAVENCIVRDTGHRWILTFGFGLVHGLGFSSFLRDLLTDGTSTVVQVLSFNVGVELGQLAILAVAFPAVAWLRRGAAEERRRRLVWIGSAPILLFGLGWLVERLLGLEFMPL